MLLGSLRNFLKCACMCARLLQSVQLFVTPWTAAHQAPLSMGFSSKNTEVVALPSSKGSSRPRDWNREPASPVAPAL